MPRLIVTCLFAATLSLAAIADTRAQGVADPAAAVRALYAATKSAKPATGGMTAIYQLAGLPLRLQLTRTGVCTVPMRSRSIKCIDIADPIGNGHAPPYAQLAVTSAAIDAKTRQITVTFSTAKGPQDLRYRFENSSSGWGLNDIQAMTEPRWSLSTLTAEGTPTPAAKP